MKKTKANKKTNRIAKPRFWVCIIGETEWNDLPNGADLPMRKAVQKEFKKVTGHDDSVTWSGWSADEKCVNRILKAWN